MKRLSHDDISSYRPWRQVLFLLWVANDYLEEVRRNLSFLILYLRAAHAR